MCHFEGRTQKNACDLFLGKKRKENKKGLILISKGALDPDTGPRELLEYGRLY